MAKSYRADLGLIRVAGQYQLALDEIEVLLDDIGVGLDFIHHEAKSAHLLSYNLEGQARREAKRLAEGLRWHMQHLRTLTDRARKCISETQQEDI